MSDVRNTTSYKHVLDAIALAASMPNTFGTNRAAMAAEVSRSPLKAFLRFHVTTVSTIMPNYKRTASD
jgi:hypothetical protein